MSDLWLICFVAASSSVAYILSLVFGIDIWPRYRSKRSFYLHGNDGFWRVLHRELTARGGVEFTKSPDESRKILTARELLQRVSFVWVQTAAGFPWELHEQEHKHLVFVNHIRNQACLTDKAALAQHLQQQSVAY